MTKYFSILLITIFLGSFSVMKAQELSREEKKALLKEIKALKKDPAKLQGMKNRNQRLAEQIASKSQEINQLKTQTGVNQNEIQKKDEGIEYLQEQLRRLRKEVEEVNATRLGRDAYDCSYTVQIGAYKNKDLTQYMDQSPNFGVETDETGFKKYTLGFFTDYFEAKYFSEYLNNTGAQTYVVGYYKGERIPDLRDMPDCHL